MPRPITILYEHPEWMQPLFAALDRIGAPHRPVDATSLSFDPAGAGGARGLVVNRMSPSAWTRGHGHAIFPTLHYLAHLEANGVDVVNGAEAFRHELSKAAQIDLMSRRGVPHPRTRVVNDAAAVPEAAAGLAFPVLVKPNIGGSGAGIRSFATAAELADAAADGFDLGRDQTLLVQEHLPARGDAIVRLEVVGGELLYGIRLLLEEDSFNLCPADYCRIDDGTADGVSGRGVPVEPFVPPAALADTAVELVAATGAEVGGVEYLVDDRTGVATFYDINALSNFVADAPALLGFDPYDDLARYLAERAGLRAVAVA